ncbi:MAG TPA: C39 family peptidase [Elusimicrobiales bacterium]|nr:C39 family peptidase [Elusimicrobiales bacterium]
MRGNGISLYYLTAKCGDCVSEQNSVRFVCCGKLKTDEFKQNDDRWKYELYNTTTPTYRRTIGEVGCALTSMATLINYYAKTYPELGISTTNPKKLNDILENGIKPKGFNSNHDVIFDYIKSTPISNGKITYFQRKDYSYPLSEDSIREIKSLINEDIENKLPVIIAVRRTNESETEEWKHFMVIVGKCEDKYIISDPALMADELFDINQKIKLKNKSFVGPVISIRRFSKLNK